MSNRPNLFKKYDVQDISNRISPSVALYHKQAMAVAGPFFEAGGVMICKALMPEYKGDLYRTIYHRLILMVQGRMEFKLGNKTFIAEPGDFVSTPSGTLTQRTALEPVEWIYIDINDVPLWSPLKKTRPTVRHYESAGLMYILVTEIIEALRSQDIYSIRCAHENAEVLVMLLERELRQYSMEWKPKRADGMIDLVEQIRKDPGYDWSRAALAKLVGTSERNLTDIFQKIFGTSPVKMIIRIRMEHAAAMLRESRKRVEDIGQSVGYESLVSFSRAFKNYQGISPRAYRTKYQE